MLVKLMLLSLIAIYTSKVTEKSKDLELSQVFIRARCLHPCRAIITSKAYRI